MSDLKMPTVLAFNRNLEPSDALMWSGDWNNIEQPEQWQKIELFERRNRAVKSNFKQEVLENEEELQKQVAEANLSWGDDAVLAHTDNTLKLTFTLRVVSGIELPSVCNNPEFEKIFHEKINAYLSSNIDELANRYAYNIANARFLWRNRVSAQNLKVKVSHSTLTKPIVFDPYNYPLKQTTSDDSKVIELAQLIKAGLLGDEKVLLQVEAYAQLGNGQRVWPSQEMVLNIPKGEKSRHLFELDGQAAIHSEKLGNALRTIDDWYKDFDKIQAPIAVEAYGSVTQRGKAYRSSRDDFKTLLLKWLNDNKISDNDKHFVVAMLIRGGVFGEGES